jgi:hypothetical protein
MNINTDFRIREAIAKMADAIERIASEGTPRKSDVEKLLEEFADAILEVAIHTAVSKIKTADQAKPNPATDS